MITGATNHINLGGSIHHYRHLDGDKRRTDNYDFRGRHYDTCASCDFHSCVDAQGRARLVHLA